MYPPMNVTPELVMLDSPIPISDVTGRSSNVMVVLELSADWNAEREV